MKFLVSLKKTLSFENMMKNVHMLVVKIPLLFSEYKISNNFNWSANLTLSDVKND